MRKRIFTFGEIMLRIYPDLEGERIEQARSFRIEPGGSESNVAIALAQMGHETSFISKVPDNHFKKAVLKYLRQYNVDTSYLIFGGERLGMYWTETGIDIRPSEVIYDRSHSAFCDARLRDFDFKAVCKNASWFHVSGITPAVSENMFRNTISALNSLSAGIRISVDLNYRSKLWTWIKSDRKRRIAQIMGRLCSRAYLVTANESELSDLFGYPSPSTCEPASYNGIATELFRRFKKLSYLAISLRKSYSASINEWNGVLFVKDGRILRYFVGPSYKLMNIVDRIGTGDSFTAGIIHGIIKYKKDFKRIIDFATALSALNHTVFGDASQFDEKDVVKALSTTGTGRIIR